MAEQPPPLTEEEAPAELATIVMKALEKDPLKRYQRMIDMLASLTRFLQTWDKQTRELALQACDRYHENEQLIAARNEGEHEDVAAAPLLRDLPMFEDRGGDVLKVVPFRRAKITEILRVLEEQHTRLTSPGVSQSPGSN